MLQYKIIITKGAPCYRLGGWNLPPPQTPPRFLRHWYYTHLAMGLKGLTKNNIIIIVQLHQILSALYVVIDD